MCFKKVLLALCCLFFSFQVLASGTLFINGKTIKSRVQLHTLMAKKLNFPTYYGNNLDALYDILSTDTSGDSIIKIKSLNSLKLKLGAEYVAGFIQAITEAIEENPRVVLVLE